MSISCELRLLFIDLFYWFTLWQGMYKGVIHKSTFSYFRMTFVRLDQVFTCWKSSTCCCLCFASFTSSDENASLNICWAISESISRMDESRVNRRINSGWYVVMWTKRKTSSIDVLIDCIPWRSTVAGYVIIIIIIIIIGLLFQYRCQKGCITQW